MQTVTRYDRYGQKGDAEIAVFTVSKSDESLSRTTHARKRSGNRVVDLGGRIH